MRFLFISVLITAAAAAQEFPEPPPIMQIVRAPGAAASSARAYAKANAPVQAIGMQSVTGFPETWTLEAHYSFESIEALDQKFALTSPAPAPNVTGDVLGDDTLAPTRTVIAVYREGWSYRPMDAAHNFSKARYFQVSVFRIRPGARASFGDLVRLYRATADAVNLNRPELVYQVISGAPSGTLLFVAPLPSLGVLDEETGPLPIAAEGLAAARKDSGALAAEAELSREHLLFRVEPRLSYVSDEFAGADREFWRR